MDFNVLGKLLTRYVAFLRYWYKNRHSVKVHQDFESVYDSVKRKVLLLNTLYPRN